jgi:hypothetical protein
MRSALIALTGAIALAPAAGPAAAQSANDRDDVRCIIVLTAVAQDPNQREAASKGTFYYLGRLDARGVSGKLGPMMLTEAKAITSAAQAQMELKRCVAELNQRSEGLQSAFQQVRAAAPKPAPAPATPTKK